MADNNRNQDRQSYNQDWEKHRHRFSDQNDEYNQNQENYGSQNTGYGQNRGTGGNYGQSSGYSGGSGQRGDMSGYSSGQYGSQGGYGNQRYGNTSGNYGQGSSGGYDESSLGSGYGNRSERDRQDWQGNYGQEEWRRNTGSGHGSQGYSGSSYGSSGQGNYGSGGYSSNYGRRDYNRDRERNIYGGDERNYGNANQGAFDRDWWQKTKDEVSSWFGDNDAERRRRIDRQVSGGYRGKGPKDYKRSEDRIREDVCDRLSDDDLLDATHITVQVEGTEVILTGNVNSRDQKRRAEDVAESISGVRNVENRLKVQRRDDDDDRSKWPRADADEAR